MRKRRISKPARFQRIHRQSLNVGDATHESPTQFLAVNHVDLFSPQAKGKIITRYHAPTGKTAYALYGRVRTYGSISCGLEVAQEFRRAVAICWYESPSSAWAHSDLGRKTRVKSQEVSTRILSVWRATPGNLTGWN